MAPLNSARPKRVIAGFIDYNGKSVLLPGHWITVLYRRLALCKTRPAHINSYITIYSIKLANCKAVGGGGG